MLKVKDYHIDYQMKRIQLFDTRWYEVNGVKYPSVTTILNAKAKPYALMKWTKQMGLNADFIGDEAMKEGRQVHYLCEDYLKGKEVRYTDDIKMHEVWIPFIRFTEFCKEYEVEPLLIEQELYSAKYGYAGTMDLLCTLAIDKKRYLFMLDIKRSKQSGTAYEYQIASYMEAFHEMGMAYLLKDSFSEKTELRAGLILLAVETKKGYRLVEVDNLTDKMGYFLAVKKVWEGENKSFDMTAKEYPTEIINEKYKLIYDKLNKGAN